MRRREVRRLVLPAALVSALVITALLAPVLPLTNPVQMEVAARLAPPSATHILGQDEYGRDVLSRIVWGARVSLSVAFLSAVIASVLGTVLGLLGGYFRGLVELVTIRPAEAILCFPPILLALLVVSLLGPGAVTSFWLSRSSTRRPSLGSPTPRPSPFADSISSPPRRRSAHAPAEFSRAPCCRTSRRL